MLKARGIGEHVGGCLKISRWTLKIGSCFSGFPVKSGIVKGLNKCVCVCVCVGGLKACQKENTHFGGSLILGHGITERITVHNASPGHTGPDPKKTLKKMLRHVTWGVATTYLSGLGARYPRPPATALAIPAPRTLAEVLPSVMANTGRVRAHGHV